jgi:nucleotide-binding universal stress UspA family protein
MRMPSPDRILVAYDGSPHAAVIFDDLLKAGLPRQAECLVLSVAERWLPAFSGRGDLSEPSDPGRDYATRLATEAAERLRAQFPSWQVASEAAMGSPARIVLERSEQWSPSLIVMGALGRSAWERLLIGSVSHKVSSEARCSVRVARRHWRAAGSGNRVVIAYDGLNGADNAVEAFASRNWPRGTRVVLHTSVGFGFAPVSKLSLARDYDRARGMQQLAEQILREAGLDVTPTIREDDPKLAIVKEAEEFGADCIFIGSNDEPPLTRFLLGTVSEAVVSRAPCSVEIVRQEPASSSGASRT